MFFHAFSRRITLALCGLLLAFVFFIFAFTDFIKGNGFLAVYIAGLIVGNNKLIYKKSLA